LYERLPTAITEMQMTRMSIAAAEKTDCLFTLDVHPFGSWYLVILAADVGLTFPLGRPIKSSATFAVYKFRFKA
jgi:hypothetical protein